MTQGKDPAKLLRGLDAAIHAAGELARRRVEVLRRHHTDLSDAQLLRKLDKTFTTAVVSTGAATGAAAAIPGAGTGVALAAAAGDASWFLTAAATYVLAAAELRGVRVETFEHERARAFLARFDKEVDPHGNYRFRNGPHGPNGPARPTTNASP